MKEKIILGIDPGTRHMGYGLIRVEGDTMHMMRCGVINLVKISTHELKLKKIFERITQLIIEFAPDEMALEAPFFGKNVQSMLKLGRAQGVAMAAALVREIPIVEYPPKSVKLSVTGNGNATKEQVAYMLETLLKVKIDTEFLDATDALGVAVCHHFQSNSLHPSRSGTKKGWGAFVAENPGRMK